MEVDHPEAAGIAQVLDALPSPCVLVATDTGAVLHANAAARALSALYDDGSPLTDADGNPLPPDLRPRARAARGERLDGVVVRGGPGVFEVHAAPIHDLVPGASILQFREITAQERVRAALDARDQFIAVVGHELRSPLTTARLNLQMLERHLQGLLDERTAEMLGASRRQLERIHELVDRLMAYGAIRGRGLSLQPEDADLRHLMGELRDRYALLARHARTDLALTCDDTVPVRWDVTRIEQLVGNLISNALKYGAGRPVELRAEEHRADFDDLLRKPFTIDQLLTVVRRNLPSDDDDGR